MYLGLLEDAKNDGIEKVYVDAIVQSKKRILLIEPLGYGENEYTVPNAIHQGNETIMNALERAVVGKTMMRIESVLRYVGHYDLDLCRHLFFVVTTTDTYSLEECTGVAFCWLEPKDCFAYPIKEQLKDIIELYSKS